jgi:hypothetical protein
VLELHLKKKKKKVYIFFHTYLATYLVWLHIWFGAFFPLPLAIKMHTKLIIKIY